MTTEKRKRIGIGLAVAGVIAVICFIAIHNSLPQGPPLTLLPSVTGTTRHVGGSAALDWNHRLGKAYVATPIKYPRARSMDADDAGVAIFDACFSFAPGECVRTLHDSFRKLRIFNFPSRSDLMTPATVSTYVSLPDGGMPMLFLAPVVLQEEWLFIRKIQIMSDGVLVLEKDFLDDQVSRQTMSGRVHEQADFALSPSQILAVAQLTSQSHLIIRISGRDGHVTVGRDDTELFLESVRKASAVQAALVNALSEAHLAKRG